MSASLRLPHATKEIPVISLHGSSVVLRFRGIAFSRIYLLKISVYCMGRLLLNTFLLCCSVSRSKKTTLCFETRTCPVYPVDIFCILIQSSYKLLNWVCSVFQNWIQCFSLSQYAGQLQACMACRCVRDGQGFL